MKKSQIILYFNSTAKKRDYWLKRNWYYHKELEKFFMFIIPENSSILEIGSGTGNLISAFKFNKTVGIDINEEMVKIAKSKYPHLEFYVDDIENLSLNKKFDYVIMQDLIGHLSDNWEAFRNLRELTSANTRVIITYYNYLWEAIILLAEKLRLKMKQPHQNWLSLDDIENLLYLNDFEVIKKGRKFLFPIYIPIISNFINKYIAKLPLVRKLCLITFIIARKNMSAVVKKEYSCSVIIPCKNEVGNIEGAVRRIPEMGKHTEIIFVNDKSTDGTDTEVKRLIKIYPEKDIKLVQGSGEGKAKAVWSGFEKATGDILMILDGDLTVMPEELPMFFKALVEGKGEFVNGCRLVYQMEKEAMRLLNILGNKLFGIVFSYLLSQRIKDTLCGTKAFFKNDYLRMRKYFGYFGDYDRWGDYDLLFSASKLNLKIIEIPVHYLERTFGRTKMNKRLKHGWMMFKMCLIAAKKLKFPY